MNKKQKILAVFALSLILFLLLGNSSWAQETDPVPKNPIIEFFKGILDWGGSVIGWVGAGAIGGILYFIGLIIGGLAALGTMIAGWLVNFAVGLNYSVLDNPLIEIGWKISRDLANLGFVLFIIIIAIATILRLQQYGAKNTLGKLIAVALLVNFSLVFAGIFIDFSNMLTNFFIKNIDGGALSSLGAALVAPFKIQGLLEVTDVETGMQEASKNISTPGELIEHNISLLLIAGLTALAAFCLFAFGIMFLIRFVALSILLVVVPLACLFWILPITRKIWDQWWNQFMKWIIFAPVASFFLYLGVYLMNNYDKWIGGQAQSAQGIGTAALIPETTLIKGLYVKIANLIITGGFMLGGLIAANSFGITGAKAFLGMAGAAGKWARGTIGRMGAAAATRPLRGTWAQTQIEKMQKAGLGGNKFVRAISRPLRTMGGALSAVGVEQGVKSVQQAEARLKNRFASDRSLALALPTLSHTDQIAAVKRLMKNKTMNLVEERVLDSMIGNKDTENVFKRYGAGKEYGDFQKAAGRNYEMVNAKTAEEKEAATIAFHSTYDPKDYVSLRTNAIISDKDSGTTIAAIMRTNPGALAKLIPKLKSKDFDEISPKIYDEAIRMMMGKDFNIGAKVGLEVEKKLDWLKKQVEREEYKKFQPIYKSITKNLGGRITGYLEIPIPPMT